jgi:hypothetical protein
VLLDCTNPVTPELTHLTLGHTTSEGEQVARLAPTARVVKVFNTNGAGNMADPDYGGHRVTMPFAGGDDGANRVAAPTSTPCAPPWPAWSRRGWYWPAPSVSSKGVPEKARPRSTSTLLPAERAGPGHRPV